MSAAAAAAAGAARAQARPQQVRPCAAPAACECLLPAQGQIRLLARRCRAVLERAVPHTHKGDCTGAKSMLSEAAQDAVL